MIGRATLARGRLTGSRGVTAFQHRNYRLFFWGQLISLVGTWMQQVAQAWLVLTLTNDPFMLGVVAAAQFLPVLVFGLFGGIVASDQFQVKAGPTHGKAAVLPQDIVNSCGDLGPGRGHAGRLGIDDRVARVIEMKWRRDPGEQWL